MEETKKLTTKEVLAIAKADLKAAEPLRKDWDSKINTWKSEYNGEPYGNEKKGRSQIVSRDIKKQSEWQHASLIDPFVSSPDIIKATPVTFEDRPMARQAELLLNTQFCRQFNRYTFMTKGVKVLDQEGTVTVMTGWEYEDTEVEVEVPIIEMNPLTGQPEITGTTTQTQTKVIKNRPTAKIVRNEDFYADPTCQDDLDKAQFVIYRFETDLSTLKSDGRYKNLNKINSNEEDYDYISPDDTAFKFSDDARKKLVVYEYWGNIDVDGSGITKPIVISWVNDVVIRFQDNPYPDSKPPFLVVPFNSVPFQLFGEANAELLSDSQKIKTATLRGYVDNMALSNNGQKGVRKGALDGINRKRWNAGEHFEFNGTPGDFYDGHYNQIPSSAFQMFELMNNDIESMTGIKNFGGGINGGSLGGTATGARGALDATSTRRLNIVRNISENMIKPLMRKWMAYNAEFLEEDQVTRITNEPYIPMKKDNMSGTIDIDITVSTAEDNAAKAQELGFMMQTMSQTMDPKMRNMLLAEIARLHKMPDLAKSLEEYKPQPDPMMQEKAQLEIALLKAQVFNEQAKGKENAVDVELKKAKTASELAKAGKTGSETDKLDQDFLANDAGIPHQQEMEKKAFDHDNALKSKAFDAINRQQL